VGIRRLSATVHRTALLEAVEYAGKILGEAITELLNGAILPVPVAGTRLRNMRCSADDPSEWAAVA
jgi:hypothetical protein